MGGMMGPPVKRRRGRFANSVRSNGARPNPVNGRLIDAALGIELGAPIEFDLDALRPRTRAECVAGLRPCPWVSCRHHLMLDVNPETGSISLCFTNRSLDQLEDTCSLDVADRGGHTLEQVGTLLNVTRERTRQLELRALHALRINDAAPSLG